MTSEAVEAPGDGDRTLLERLRAGEDAAFGELFSRHSAAVLRLALSMTTDRSEADDLTAEAFFRVLQAIRRGAGPVDNVRGYLLIVVRRVAWEWSMRRRDVPVSDEELTFRAPSNPDTSGQFTERNLIRRAFTSLPERWRNVLWKMEVEGERPAAVATNFGLSPNATAALARRARQGLRAAYLQAHLTAERSATGCRSVLEKLGAYTAGTTSGIERRRILAHLSTCASCTAMHAELRDVFSGLRPHNGVTAVPVVAAAGWQLGASLKAFLASTKFQAGLAATSAAAIGVLGFVFTPWGVDRSAPVDLAGKRAIEMHVDAPRADPLDPVDVRESSLDDTIDHAAEEPDAPDPAAPGTSTTSTTTTTVPAVVPERVPSQTSADATSVVARDEDAATDAETFDVESPIVYGETTTETYTQEYEDYTLVQETTTVKQVNSLDQTRTTTTSTRYTKPKTPRTQSATTPTT
ncbi:sigma-70 family RNA polymerase sigma factor [Actinophytocola oryzae]|uniref:RNA polymerase sigma factor (Sigma-70 family) n=1 Tax=Actinophytocola oryzae TaxID=502181 RepID=A0A4R7VMY6_9PSEU|nr:sigma-70 family RNA polymerase sigma factor [Actinophytocola oryzae]TDV50904.1 RNA polymerase sigma factor (sigma-70 family) [Actinophytocola oryzae]